MIRDDSQGNEKQVSICVFQSQDSGIYLEWDQKKSGTSSVFFVTQTLAEKIICVVTLRMCTHRTLVEKKKKIRVVPSCPFT